MLSKEKILHLMKLLNQELANRNQRGEIGLVGGAVMCLVYNARSATKDVDAIFEPAQMIREIAKKIAEQEGLSPDWLNDGAKGYIQPSFGKQEVLSLSHLNVWAPEPKYMLVMKCLSARWDTSDRDDVLFLVRLLNITDSVKIFKLLERYYPANQIPTKTKFFIEELLAKPNTTSKKSPVKKRSSKQK